MESVKIASRFVGGKAAVFVVAEAGISHNGDVQRGVALIDAAAAAGADAIKFQTHLPEKEMLRPAAPPMAPGVSSGLPSDPWFDLLKRCELSESDHRALKHHATRRGIIFLSSPFSREAADMLDHLGVAAFKIGSSELTNIPFLLHIARKGKPIILSTGMSEMSEIAEAVQAIRRINRQLVLLQCTSLYPTRYHDVNLGVIPLLRQRFRCPVGLSDHTEGIYTALGAVALGACVIEKHFTMDRAWMGPDQKASIDQRELGELVRGVRAVRAALGTAKRVTKEEAEARRLARESVVTVADIPAGARIRPDMVWVKRPGTGIPAKDLPEVIGRIARRDIPRDTVVHWRDLRQGRRSGR